MWSTKIYGNVALTLNGKLQPVNLMEKKRKKMGQERRPTTFTESRIKFLFAKAQNKIEIKLHANL
jgi:hypothetical protein